MNTAQYILARNGGVGLGVSGHLGHNSRWKSDDINQQIDNQQISEYQRINNYIDNVIKRTEMRAFGRMI